MSAALHAVVRVLQVGRRLDLGQEALGSYDRSEFGLEDVEPDLPLVAEVIGRTP